MQKDRKQGKGAACLRTKVQTRLTTAMMLTSKNAASCLFRSYAEMETFKGDIDNIFM